jgi:hypothetical protein
MVDLTCFRRFFLFFLSLVSYGVALGMFIYFIVLLKIHWAEIESNSLLFYAVIGFVLSAIALAFAIVSSCNETTCSSLFLAIIYLIFLIAAFGLGIVIFAFKGRILEITGSYYEDDKYKIKATLDFGLNCCGWKSGCDLTEEEKSIHPSKTEQIVNESKDCFDEFLNAYSNLEKIIAPCCFVVGFILIFGAFFTFHSVCGMDNGRMQEDFSKNEDI